MSEHYFDHEHLDVFKLALEINRWFVNARFPAGRTHLRDQAQRASDSVVLNIAEGAANGFSKQGKRHFRIALGSAAEVAAVLAICPTIEGADHALLMTRRVGAMLRAMAR